MQEKLAYIYLNQTWAVSFIFTLQLAQGFPNPEVIQSTQGFYAEQKYRSSSLL